MSEYLDELKGLELRIRQSEGAPQQTPKVLQRLDIECIETIFQPRKIRDWTSQPHIEVMASALKTERTSRLDPVTVFWIGDAWCCIDGHHRLSAYDNAHILKDIPVKVFEGSLDDARLYSYRSNSRDKLPMRAEDKSNGAWKLVVAPISGNVSKRMIADATGVSERTVASMREVRTLLKENHKSLQLADMDWKEARLRAQGITFDSERMEYADFVEKEGIKLATRLRRDYGKVFDKNPDILAFAIERCNDSLPRLLTQAWGHTLNDDEYFEEDVEFLPDGIVDPVF